MLGVGGFGGHAEGGLPSSRAGSLEDSLVDSVPEYMWRRRSV